MDRDRPLPHRRHHGVDIERLELQPRPGPDAQALQAGGGQHGGIGRPVGELPQPGLDVATDAGKFQAGEPQRQLHAPARAVGGHGADRLHSGAADQDVPGIGAGQVARDRQSGHRLAGQILRAVNRDVGLAPQQTLLEFGGEKALAAFFSRDQSARLSPVVTIRRNSVSTPRTDRSRAPANSAWARASGL